MNIFYRVLMLLFIVLMPLNSLYCEEPALNISIGGDVKKPGQWSVELLKEQFADQIKEVQFTDPFSSWQKKSGNGIPLLSVIMAAEPELETVTKFHKDRMHYDMSFLVILEAKDQFRVYFTLAELMPQLGSAEIYLVRDKGGEQLSEKERPLRVATLNTKMPDREIYGISNITIVDCDKLAKQLKAEK
jgi:hypothetical protein